MKKLTILMLCVVCVVFASLTFAQGTDKPAAKPETKTETKTEVKAEPAKEAVKAAEVKKEEVKPVDVVKLGEAVKAEAALPIEKVAAEMATMVGKEVVTAGIVVEVEPKGAWIKIGEKEKVQVNAATGWVFPADAKGMKALVGGKVDKTFIVATGAELHKAEMKKEEPKKEEPKTTEMKKEEPKKEEPKKEEPKKEEPKKEAPKTN